MGGASARREGPRAAAGAGDSPPSSAARLSHFDADGAARMVDVGAKAVTARRARARADVVMAPATLRRIVDRALEKGDARETARIAGILAAKRTGDLIPLCHPLPLDVVTIDFRDDGARCLTIECEARTTARTGVEMEAMVGASIAALTIYDMVKAVDRSVEVRAVVLLEKEGGKSGPWRRDERADAEDRAPLPVDPR